MGSSKQGASDGNRAISRHILTLHQRLQQALSLGKRTCDNKEKKWQCFDIETQRHVVRSVSAFLDSISGDPSNHSLLKDSLADIVSACVWILQCKNEAVVSMAASMVVKLITNHSPMIQPYAFDLIHPLSSLLSSRKLDIAIACATALNAILSNLTRKKEKQAWETLKETRAVVCVISNIQGHLGDVMRVEYFEVMILLLSTILWRWPQSRFSVWNDDALMKVLEASFVRPGFSDKVVILKLYTSLVLCYNGAKKLLENGESILHALVWCMSSSESPSVRIEGFRLAQCLAADEQGCLKMTSLCCKPLVEAIVRGMTRWELHPGKVATDQMSLLVEACHLALITRWAGEHHNWFWDQGIDKVLLDLLFENFNNKLFEHPLSLEEQMSIAQEGLSTNFFLVLRPYIWDILGWLAIHCREDFKPKTHINEICINILITCACLAFVEVIHKGYQICNDDVLDFSRSESASRAVLMMIYSPSKYISHKLRFILSEVLKPNDDKILKRLLHSLNYISSADNSELPNTYHTVITLVGLTCYSGLPHYQSHVIKAGGMKALLTFVDWCLSRHVHMGRKSFAPHLYNVFGENMCCWPPTEEWEGNDTLLLYSLWGLALLLQHSDDLEVTKAELVKTLHNVLNNISAAGPRWFSAHLLTYFGFFGFPNTLGKGIGKALKEEELADMQLLFTTSESVSVHKVILAVRCPSLLPSEQLTNNEEQAGYTSQRYDQKRFLMSKSDVRMSTQVDQEALQKLLEFVYLGYLEAGDELVRKLKTLAKGCNLQILFQMLCRKIPKWGTPIPNSDLILALSPVGQQFSDVLLEAKPTNMQWMCNFCSLLVPHMHVHKIVLWSSCEYLRALFQSGMQESHSQTIKVPISWDAMIKLVHWFYSYELPNPPSGCLWDNMNTEQRLYELQHYVELYWLAEFWILEDIQDACFRVILSFLNSDRELSVKVIQIAASLSLWKLAEVAADYMAPIYHKLRESGDLEEMDDVLVDLVRAASVRLSHNRGT